MKIVLSSLINDGNIYQIVVQIKNGVDNLTGESSEIAWRQIYSPGLTLGKDFTYYYEKTRQFFIKKYLRDFRFNHYPLRIAIFDKAKATSPIICEYADKVLVKFAMSIPDFYKEAGDLYSLTNELRSMAQKNSPLIIDGRYLRDSCQEKYLNESLGKLNDMIKEIEESANSAQAIADNRLDCYTADLLKLYDKGGILRTSD